MKKNIFILIFSFFFIEISYSKEIKLECGSKDDFKNMLYVKVDKKTFEIYQPSSANRVKFKTHRFDDYVINGRPRGLDKATTTHDTHLTNWESWDESKFIRDHIYSVGIERVQGFLGIGRSISPWIDGKEEYEFEIFWELECKELEKKF